MTVVDSAIEGVLADLWSNYDVNGDGLLDFSEMRLFVKDTLARICQSAKFREDIFAKMFRQFD